MAKLPAVRVTARQLAAAQPSQPPRASLPAQVWRAVRAAVQPSGGGRIITSEDLRQDLAGGWGTEAGVSVSTNTAMTVATVYACIRILANAMAMLPWRVRQRSGENGERETVVADHPIDHLLYRSPNRWQTPFQFKRWIMECQCYEGNAFAFIRKKNGVAIELVPLHPKCMSVEQVGDFDVRYRYSSYYGGQQLFDSSEIMHFYAVSLNGLWGLSPIQAARQAIGLSLAAERFGSRHFSQGVRPTGVVKLPPGVKLGEEAIVRLRNDIQTILGGVNNSHKIALLEDGLEWQNISMTAEEAQYLQSREFQSGEISKFFGVPPYMVGDIQKQTSFGSGIESQGIGFVGFTMQPWLTSAEQTADSRLFIPGEEDDLFTQFETGPLTRADIGTLSTALKTQIDAGIINPNEARHRLGLNPRTDPAGDDYAVAGKSSIDSKAAQPGATGPAQPKSD